MFEHTWNNDIPSFQHTLLSRYEKNGRDLPWRKTRDPYAIHVSETMLQQTQVSRVIPYFERWMRDIPDYQALAKVELPTLLSHWSGLGFNSRAMRLQACAKAVCEGGNGKLPQTRGELLKLPGIGPYTSAAICAFAWNQEEAVVDTNIRRTLIFLLHLSEDISVDELEKVAKSLIPIGRSRDWHNALMDIGAMELTARKTKIQSLSKQSKFEGSQRQVRGRIMKQLVKRGNLGLEEVKNEFPQHEITEILEKMKSDGLIIFDEMYISFGK